MTACFLMILFASGTTLGGFGFSLGTRIFCLSMIVGGSFALINFMAITLFQELDKIKPAEYYSIPCSFLLGILATRVSVLRLLLRDASTCEFIGKVFMIWDYGIFEQIMDSEKQYALSKDSRKETQDQIANHMSQSQRNRSKSDTSGQVKEDENWDSQSQGLPNATYKDSLLEQEG